MATIAKQLLVFLVCRWIYGLGDKGYIDTIDVGMVGYVHRVDNISDHRGQFNFSSFIIGLN